jgi:hypothetical protein
VRHWSCRAFAHSPIFLSCLPNVRDPQRQLHRLRPLKLTSTGRRCVALKDTEPPRRQASRRGNAAITNPDLNPEVLDAPNALRASPDGHECAEGEAHLHQHNIDTDNAVNGINAASAKPSISQAATTEVKAVPTTSTEGIDEAGATSAMPAATQQTGRAKRKTAGAQHLKAEGGDSNIVPADGVLGDVTAPADDAGVTGNPEADGVDGEEGDEVELKEALARPPPVNSEYLPLPWKGRLGYVRALHAPTQFNVTNMHVRLVSTPTFETQIPPCSALERAELRVSSNIGTL